MDYQQAISFIEGANERAGDMGIEAISNLLEYLHNPQEELSVIHVGGTNGKGSISAYLSYILAAAGYKVGRYISPTIREYRERIQILQYDDLEKESRESMYISEAQIVSLTEKIMAVYEQMEEQGLQLPSAFEIETALGFLYFKEEKCDVVLLEVGMGGRLDATNVITQSICTVLGAISMDHMNVLGNTLKAIAREKAGIIKKQGRVVAYDYQYAMAERGEGDEISPVLRQRAEEQKARLFFADFSKISGVNHSMSGICFSYKKYKDIFTPLLGEYQVKNAAVALEVIDCLKEQGWSVEEDAVRKGMEVCVWEGRFQVMQKNPYYIVDGAHNEDAARSLARTLELYLPGKKILFVVGILADKEYRKILQILGPYAKKMITVTTENPRALPSEQLMKEAEKVCAAVENGGTMEEALELARKQEKEFDAVLIFGSLYSLHQVYEYFEKK